MRHIDLGVGPGWVVSTRSDAAQCWEWLQDHKSDVLGLDLETNGQDPFDPAFRQRLCQFSDGHESWIIQSERPGMLDVVRICIQAHPYWLAHFAENDIRFAECTAPGSIRKNSIIPHVADLQPVLAYYDPRTVTSADKPGIDVRIKRSRGLKATAERLLPEGHLLVEAEKAKDARFAELLKHAPPDPAAATAAEHYAPVIAYFGLTGSAVQARKVLTSLGVHSPKKTPKGNDSWDAKSLADVAPTLTGEADEVVNALLALRQLKQGPDSDSYGWANIPDDDEVYWRYAGLDPLMAVRCWHKMVPELKAREQWPVVRQALKLQWHIDLATLRGKLVDGPYAKWLDALYLDVINTHADELERLGIRRSASGAEVGKTFNQLGITSPKITGEGKESWDKHALAKLTADPATPTPALELIKTVKSVRGATKFRAAYVQPMLDALRRDGRVHCGMRAIGTITGRQSAQRPALQQLPKRSDKRIRPAFIAPEGWVYVTCDVSQGEPRMMAARSGDPNLRRDLLAGDFYSSLAVLAYGSGYKGKEEGKTAGTDSFAMRDGSKIGFLLRCYGGGDEKLAEALGQSLTFAKETRARWDGEYHVLAAYERRLNQQPAITLDSGRIIPLIDRYRVDEHDQMICGDRPSRNGLNYDTQGSLADYVNNSVEKVIDAGWSWALRMLVHDEIVGCVPDAKAEEFAQVLTDAMTSVYRGMPFECEATIEGRTWMAQPESYISLGMDELQELTDVD